MSKHFTITLAQLNPTVGDIAGNIEKILAVYKKHKSTSDLIAFSEMVVTAYPTDDLILKQFFIDRVMKGVEKLAQQIDGSGAGILVSAPWRDQGKVFNAPNDGVVHPDGGIWFTDPGYGSLGNYEGNLGTLELKEAVYRIDPADGKVALVTDALFKPNGLCFSPDYKLLYIADTGSTHYPAAPKNIQVWDVVNGRTLAKGRSFASMELVVRDQKVAGLADGIRCDTDGNVWAGAGWADIGDGYDGVHVFAPDGQRIGQILLPEICSNVCFGGPRRNRLFMTASQSLYSVYVEAIGAHFC